MAKALRIHPCSWRPHLNSALIWIMAMGMMTLSAELMRLAHEHSATVLDDLVNFAMATVGVPKRFKSVRCSCYKSSPQWHERVWAWRVDLLKGWWSMILVAGRNSTVLPRVCKHAMWSGALSGHKEYRKCLTLFFNIGKNLQFNLIYYKNIDNYFQLWPDNVHRYKRTGRSIWRFIWCLLCVKFVGQELWP